MSEISIPESNFLKSLTRLKGIDPRRVAIDLRISLMRKGLVRVTSTPGKRPVLILTEEGVKAVTSGEKCEVRQYSDAMRCVCGIAYDTNDPFPPNCPKTGERLR